MRKRSRRPIGVVAWLAILGVIPSSCVSLSPGQETARAERGMDPDRIGVEDFARFENYTAFQLIRQVRPGWLRSRSRTYEVKVYLDEVPVADGVRRLQSLEVRDLLEIRHLSAADATTRFGTDHTDGAILVTTRS